MMVGDNIAVLGNDKAAAGRSRLHPLPENVGRHGGAVDAHHAAHRGGVHLGGGHKRLAGDLFHRNLLDGAVTLVNGSAAAHTNASCQGSAAETRAAAYQRAGQQQGSYLYTALFPYGILLFFRRRLPSRLLLLRAVLIMIEAVGIVVASVLGPVLVVLAHMDYLLSIIFPAFLTKVCLWALEKCCILWFNFSNYIILLS